jgi:hypothetical protein
MERPKVLTNRAARCGEGSLAEVTNCSELLMRPIVSGKEEFVLLI